MIDATQDQARDVYGTSRQHGCILPGVLGYETQTITNTSTSGVFAPVSAVGCSAPGTTDNFYASPDFSRPMGIQNNAEMFPPCPSGAAASFGYDAPPASSGHGGGVAAPGQQSRAAFGTAGGNHEGGSGGAAHAASGPDGGGDGDDPTEGGQWTALPQQQVIQTSGGQHFIIRSYVASGGGVNDGRVRKAESDTIDVPGWPNSLQLRGYLMWPFSFYEELSFRRTPCPPPGG